MYLESMDSDTSSIGRPFPGQGVRDAHDVDHTGPHGYCAQAHIDDECSCPDPTAHLFNGQMEYVCLCCDGTMPFGEHVPAPSNTHPIYKIPHQD